MTQYATQNYYTGTGLGLHHLGQAADQLSPGTAEPSSNDRLRWGIYGALSIVSSGLSAYHGYRRNRGSVGWAVGWALLGGIFPIITPAIAFAQGFGKPKVSSNRRRRRSRARSRR
jgi:hypothetical protein